MSDCTTHIAQACTTANVAISLDEATLLLKFAVIGAMASSSDKDWTRVLEIVKKFTNALGVAFPDDLIPKEKGQMSQIVADLYQATDALVRESEVLVQSTDGEMKDRFEEIAGDLRRVRARLYSIDSFCWVNCWI